MNHLDVYLDRLKPAPGAEARRRADAMPTGLWDELRARGLPSAVAALIAAHLAETALLLVSWVCIGSGALSGRLDYGWLLAWVLALAATVPLHCTSTWLQGVVGVGVGGLLKERLLALSTTISSRHWRQLKFDTAVRAFLASFLRIWENRS